jgi:predicted nucleic acid-binding Zn ribbon protein
MGFESLLHILARARLKYPSMAKRLDEASALSRWEAAVGPGIAKHTRAIRVQDSVLWIEVDHPIWKSELHHRKRQILDAINGPPTGDPKGGKAGSKQPPITDLFFADRRGPG